MSDDFNYPSMGYSTSEAKRLGTERSDGVRRMIAALEGSANRLADFSRTSQISRSENWVTPATQEEVESLLACCRAQQVVLELFLSEFADLAGFVDPLLFAGLREYFKMKKLAQSKSDV